MAKPRKPKNEHLVSLTCMVDPSFKEWINQQAEATEVSQGWIVRQLLKVGRETIERREGDSNPARPSHLHRQKKPTEPATAASVA